ncbi:MAG: hypothetical protein ACI90V_006679, partial [Bacillariaceae sp.]
AFLFAHERAEKLYLLSGDRIHFITPPVRLLGHPAFTVFSAIIVKTEHITVLTIPTGISWC